MSRSVDQSADFKYFGARKYEQQPGSRSTDPGWIVEFPRRKSVTRATRGY
jgi:hypothetical protein